MDKPVELFEELVPLYHHELGLRVTEPKIINKVSFKYLFLFSTQVVYYVSSIAFVFLKAKALTEYAAVTFLLLTTSATFYLNIRMPIDWLSIARLINRFKISIQASK